jgi:hypothetical protein
MLSLTIAEGEQGCAGCVAEAPKQQPTCTSSRTLFVIRQAVQQAAGSSIAAHAHCYSAEGRHFLDEPLRLQHKVFPTYTQPAALCWVGRAYIRSQRPSPLVLLEVS